METQIVFKKVQEDNTHYRKLRARIKHVLTNLPEGRKKSKVYMAFSLPIFYAIIYLTALSFVQNKVVFYGLYSFLGVISVLIFMNIIHDAVHNNVFKKPWMNNAIILIFDLLGGNSYIWKKRHVLLHHNYQNIAGWDSDIEQAGLIKIFKHEKPTIVNKNQHWLIFFLYPMYLFNWIFIRDFKDFFLKKRDIKKVCEIPIIEHFKMLLFKAFFVFYIIVVPVFLGADFIIVLGALFILMTTGSVFALLSLLTPHVNTKNLFPMPDSHGELNVSWFSHQFNTTNDISLNNWFTRNIMGNFNFHLVHHLFPNVNSVYAPEITMEIQKYAKENGFDYRSYKLGQALRYHYQLIKNNAYHEDFFEEDM